MRILIVEDEVAVARQIASALTEAGHDPKAVHDGEVADRKSTRLNSSHSQISYAVFCLKKKNINSYDAITDELNSARSAYTLPHFLREKVGRRIVSRVVTMTSRYPVCRVDGAEVSRISR